MERPAALVSAATRHGRQQRHPRPAVPGRGRRRQNHGRVGRPRETAVGHPTAWIQPNGAGEGAARHG